VAIKEYLPIELAVRERDSSVHPVSEQHHETFQWGRDLPFTRKSPRGEPPVG